MRTAAEYRRIADSYLQQSREALMPGSRSQLSQLADAHRRLAREAEELGQSSGRCN